MCQKHLNSSVTSEITDCVGRLNHIVKEKLKKKNKEGSEEEMEKHRTLRRTSARSGFGSAEEKNLIQIQNVNTRIRAVKKPDPDQKAQIFF